MVFSKDCLTQNKIGATLEEEWAQSGTNSSWMWRNKAENEWCHCGVVLRNMWLSDLKMEHCERIPIFSKKETYSHLQLLGRETALKTPLDLHI